MGSSAPATTPTVQPSVRTLPREKPPVSSLREPPAALKPDTTQFALPEIKTKEYIRSRRQKQNFLKEEANGIENITADSETFSPVIRTRETVREQQKLHVSHSAEQEQPALPQIRTRQPQTASMPADIEPTKPEVPQPPLPDIKSKQKYIAAQQPTQVTPVQANPQQAVRQTGMKAAHGEPKLCQPTLANETVTMPASRNVAPTKPARVQKQARPAFVKKQKIKTASKAKIKSATPAAKALPSKATTAAPKQAATVIRKGQVLRDTAIKAAKTAKEAGKKVLRAIVAAAEKLAAAIGAGGAAAVSVVVVILLVGMLFASPLGILFAGEDTGTEIKIPDAVATLNSEFTDEIYCIMEDHPYDELDMQEGMEAAMLQNWRNVLAVYAVKVSTDEEHGLDVMTMDEEKLQLLREIFFDANKLEYELTTRTVDGEQITTLHISAQIKDAMQMADEYSFTAQQREMLEELLKPDYDDIFLSLIGNYQPGGTPIGPVDISDIQGTLPDDLDPLRESIVLTAYQLLGKVTYFWGGKSLVLGWDSRWGTPTTVTAPGSGSTGKVLPFGLDCSGFVDWTFYNATSGAYLPGRGGGAASQHGYCTNISWSDALPGDLVFYADDSHVGIVCGYDSVGNLLVIHCSGGQNGVVVTGREGFAVAARPDLFTDTPPATVLFDGADELKEVKSDHDYFDANIDGMRVTITPKTGLQPGTYTDTLYVHTENGAVHFIAVTLTVTPKPEDSQQEADAALSGVLAAITGTNPFSDVPGGAYYNAAVRWAVENGIAKGTSAAAFSPDAACTRGQIVTFLYRAAGSPAGYANSGYTDVPETSYCAAPVAWAVALRITSGTGALTFSPDDLCTRAQIVTFLYRANA